MTAQEPLTTTSMSSAPVSSAPMSSAPVSSTSVSSAPGTQDLAHLTPEQPDWKAVTVEHLDGERYVIGVRGHLITVDQPLADGGTDTAPTPTELFVSSVVSCVAFYAGRYLNRHGLSRRGLRATASFTMATDRPARIASITVSVSAPTLPEERQKAFLAVIGHCTVHNTLHQIPDIRISVV